jgi:hypothetical protein
MRADIPTHAFVRWAEEYTQLATYARFRILLLRTLLGIQVEAQTVYDTLQNKFPQNIIVTP